jgi:hypothetical protein
LVSSKNKNKTTKTTKKQQQTNNNTHNNNKLTFSHPHNRNTTIHARVYTVWKAAIGHNIPELEKLLRSGVDPNFPNEHQQTLLHVAAGEV